MTYELVRGWAAMAGLLLFIALFAAVLAYVFWPGNKASFERARHLPLQEDPGEAPRSDSHGR